MPHLSSYAKFLVTIFVLSITTASSWAQLHFEESNVGYLADTPASMHRKSGSLDQASGEGVVWDFSDIETTLSTTVEFEAVENAGTSNFRDGTDYFTVNEEGITRDGTNMAGSNQAPIEWAIMRYDYELGDTWSQSFSFSTISNCSFSGNSVAKAEGHGTLILPSGEFTNVTRFKVTTNYTVDCLNGPTSWFEYTYVRNYYFKPGCHVELLRTYYELEEEWYEPYSWESCDNPCLASSSVSQNYYYIKESTIPDLCIVEGCADENACNYVPEALFTDSCFFENESCDDGDELTEGDVYVDCICAGIFGGDANEDGIVDVDDLLAFLPVIGCMGNCEMDFNNDAVVNMLDLLVFLSYF